MSFSKLMRRLMRRLYRRWLKFCLRHSGTGRLGRVASRVACFGTTPFHHRSYFADLTAKGFVAPSAVISHPNTFMGNHVYIGDRVMVSKSRGGGFVDLASHVHIFGDCFLETGQGGKISVGEGTHIQPGCRIHAFVSDINIGRKVDIAPCCALYSYDHESSLCGPIMDQPLVSDGNLVVGDGAWIGHGVTILQGVRIGSGAVIGAGAVVTHDVPDNAIAAGVPAKVIGKRFTTSEERISAAEDMVAKSECDLIA